jgi:hypothetical protein
MDTAGNSAESRFVTDAVTVADGGFSDHKMFLALWQGGQSEGVPWGVISASRLGLVEKHSTFGVGARHGQAEFRI